jgi:hypothetical protein
MATQQQFSYIDAEELAQVLKSGGQGASVKVVDVRGEVRAERGLWSRRNRNSTRRH